MESNTCRWCGTEIVEGVEKCTSCGARVAPPRVDASATGDGAPASGNGSGNGSEPTPAAVNVAAAPAWASPAAAAEPSADAMQNWAPPVQVGAPAWASPAAASTPPAQDAPAPVAAPAPPPQTDVPQPPPGLAEAAPPPWTPTEPPARSRTSPVVYVAAAVVAAIAVFGGMRMLAGDVVTFPDTVLGQPKMTGPQVDGIIDTLEDTKVAGQSFRAAFYGSGTPALMIVVADASSLADPEESWKGFGGGFASTSGTSIEQKAKQTATIEGVNYICAPVAEMRSTVCQWTDDRTTGYIFDYTVGDPKASITRTQSVYEIVVTG